MLKTKDEKLKPNPFTTYRDPETGKWLVMRPSAQKPTPVLV